MKGRSSFNPRDPSRAASRASSAFIESDNDEVGRLTLKYRYIPSQADVTVFKAIAAAPDAAGNPHVARWYTHIKSYAAEHASLPGSSTAGQAFISEGSAAAPAADDDDEIDLFGSDEEEDAEAEKVKAERVAAYNAKKAASGKAKPVAKVCCFIGYLYFFVLKAFLFRKSVVTMDVKPWDDETDMAALEAAVRSIEQDGLVWGASKLVAIGYGIKKLQITLVVGTSIPCIFLAT